MLAIGMRKGQPGLHRFDVPVPEIKEPDEVLIKVKEVGLDGTDFNMVRFNLQDVPEGRGEIIIGHEVVGVVEQVGEKVKSLKPGDPVAVTVRRGCGECSPCLHNVSDMCLTGRFKERGIHKLDGFLTQFIVDKEPYIVKIPPKLVKLAVITEPMSIVEKGVQQIRVIQSRLPWSCPHPEHTFDKPQWGGCKIALVVGAGPLGLMAIALLRMAGAVVYTCDIVADDSPKITLAHHMGAGYLDARTKSAGELMEAGAAEGNLDIIFEASGAADTAVQLIRNMSRSSIYVMTGIPREETLMQVDAAQFVRQVVRYNQVVVGSVNSNRSHFEMALNDIGKIAARFPDVLQAMLSQRFKLEEYEEAFTAKDPKYIKTIIEVDRW